METEDRGWPPPGRGPSYEADITLVWPVRLKLSYMFGNWKVFLKKHRWIAGYLGSNECPARRVYGQTFHLGPIKIIMGPKKIKSKGVVAGPDELLSKEVDGVGLVERTEVRATSRRLKAMWYPDTGPLTAHHDVPADTGDGPGYEVKTSGKRYDPLAMDCDVYPVRPFWPGYDPNAPDDAPHQPWNDRLRDDA